MISLGYKKIKIIDEKGLKKNTMTILYKLICKKFKILVAIITIHVYFNMKRIHSSKKLFYILCYLL